MLKREPGPPASMGYGDFETALGVAALARGPYLLGEQFTAADVVIGAGLIWGMMIKVIPERPEILTYTERLRARAASERAFAKDAELAATLNG
jgi:glutathione S-transferase